MASFLPLGQPQWIDVAALQEVVHKDAILAEALDKEGVQLGVVDHLKVLPRHQIVLRDIKVHQRGGGVASNDSYGVCNGQNLLIEAQLSIWRRGGGG